MSAFPGNFSPHTEFGSPHLLLSSSPPERMIPAMAHTVINLEENIGKTVGRRTVVRDAFHYGMELQRTASQLSRSLGGTRYPKGVFRFHSHEEADAWLMKHQIRSATNRD